MNAIQQKCAEAYKKHQNLKIAAEQVGIPWQSVYVHLRKAGIPVTGNKLVYGSDKDRLASQGEGLFQDLVPQAINQNSLKFQSKIDFLVNGYGVDVKTARPRMGHKRSETKRWAFSMKKQEMLADFVVCFCMNEDKEPVKCLLIPGEIIRHYQNISVSTRGGSKWHDYEVPFDGLRQFFIDMPYKD